MTTAMQDIAAIESMVLEVLAEQLNRPVESGELGNSFIDLGLDSLEAVFLCGALEERWSRPIDPVLVFEAASVAEFVRLVFQELEA
ncbi:acyl carrier protein [Cypionkella sp.]|jgi:acyl carrier protein|uniref:acyl carrier protein n=1 Tax=Cypionkella sp. TaxID=2811411 RepID=UPI002724F062|nr:acyl carrier protein [Cypionkella sp.]MDO8986460.1 acyl carrier protein [Cypionkella sp.]MDP2048441.1 acyl carrier protein [Cypionkella sp.]